MIMRPGQALLLPANPWFILGSLIGTLLLGMLLHLVIGGQAPWLPDLLAVTLAFWIIHQPLRVGVGSAFVLGLLLDVHQGALLGQHALAYTVLSYLASVFRRRILWFPVRAQALHVLPLFITAHSLQVVVRLAAGHGWPGWSALATPAIETLLWPVATLLLLAPQRRPHNPDDHRPI